MFKIAFDNISSHENNRYVAIELVDIFGIKMATAKIK